MPEEGRAVSVPGLLLQRQVQQRQVRVGLDQRSAVEGGSVESRRFDALARGVATAASRRVARRTLAGSVLGIVLALGARPGALVRAQEGGSSPEERAAVIASAKERLLMASGIIADPADALTCRAPLEVCRTNEVCCTGRCLRGRCTCLDNGSECVNDDECCTRRCDFPLLALVGTCKNR